MEPSRAVSGPPRGAQEGISDQAQQPVTNDKVPQQNTPFCDTTFVSQNVASWSPLGALLGTP
eukprot:2447153-Pyramimonas_sp.AAC.1